MSKLTCTLNYSISLFPDFCMFQDLLTKRIIGIRQEFGLYILDPKVLKPIVCSRIANPFEIHCHLGYPSLSQLKKPYSQFSRLSSFNCESCQYAKLHPTHSSPRVNKRVFAPLELVHSDVWLSNYISHWV